MHANGVIPGELDRVAVIVVNFNGGDMLQRCLACLRAQNPPPEKVFIVDNASTDDSALRARGIFPEFTFLMLDRNTGFAAANNHAARMAEDCDWLAMVNPDAFLAADWLARMLAATRRHPTAASFGCRLQMADGSGRLDGIGDVLHVSGLVWRDAHGLNSSNRAEADREIFSACAAAALYRKSDFLAQGGFDESFFCYVEDVDLGFRLRLAGHDCWYVSSAYVEHVGSASSGGRHSAFAAYHGHRNRIWCRLKNMPIALLLLALPLHLLGDLAVLMAFMLRGMAIVILRAYRDAWLALPAVWRARRRIQQERKASAADVWRLIDKRMWPQK